MKNNFTKFLKNSTFNDKSNGQNDSLSNDSYFDDKEDEFILDKEFKTSKNVNIYLKNSNKEEDNLDKLDIIEKTKDNHFAKVK
jgi:hypothetical protein